MPGAEKYQNYNLGARLALPLLIGDTSLVVDDQSRFTADGSFVVIVDSEYIRVPRGGVSGATFSGLIRGVEGTSPSAHAQASQITQVVTAGSAFQIWPNFVYVATQTLNYSANPQEFVPCNTSGGGISITLPLAAIAGQNCPVGVCDTVVGAGVTVLMSGSDTLIGWSPFVQQGTALFVSDGVSKWYPAGGGTAVPFQDAPPPRQTITGPYTLGASELLALFAAGTYAIDCRNAVFGRTFRLKHDNEALLEDAAVTLSRGNRSFLIENPNTGAFENSVPLTVSSACYTWLLDARYNILRLIGR